MEDSSTVSAITEDSVTTSTMAEYCSNSNFSSFLHEFKSFFYLQFDLSGQCHIIFSLFTKSRIIVHEVAQSFGSRQRYISIKKKFYIQEYKIIKRFKRRT